MQNLPHYHQLDNMDYGAKHYEKVILHKPFVNVILFFIIVQNYRFKCITLSELLRG